MPGAGPERAARAGDGPPGREGSGGAGKGRGVGGRGGRNPDELLQAIECRPVPPRAGRIDVRGSSVTGAALLEVSDPRAAESWLLRRVVALAGEARRDPSLLARPVRVVVPSRFLRQHLLGRLLEQAGGALAGVAVQTLWRMALEVLERSGELPPGPEDLAPVVIRQSVAAEPRLAEELRGLRDGFGAALPTLADFLDAGLRPEDAEPLCECLETLGGVPGHRLAEPLVGAAARAARRLGELGIRHRARVLRHAAERLREDPDRLLPSRALYVHGFADATGLALDLLEAALRSAPGGLLLVLPRDPARPTACDVGAEFARPLRERMAGLPGGVVACSDEGLGEVRPGEAEAGGRGARSPTAGRPVRDPAASGQPGGPGRVRLVRAPDDEAEAREVATRIAALLEGEEVRPEEVAVVARTPGMLAGALPRELEELGIPFSGAPGSTLALPFAVAPLRALADLLREGARATVDAWLDAAEGASWLRRDGSAVPVAADLRLALHALGAARLGEVAALDPDAHLRGRGHLPLPIRTGAGTVEVEDGGSDPDSAASVRVPAAPDEGEEENGSGAAARAHRKGGRGSDPSRIERRWLPGDVLRAAVEAAGRLRARLDAWSPEPRPGPEQLELLESVLGELGLPERFEGALERIRRALRFRPRKGSFALTRAEVALLVDAACEAVPGAPLGGAGGGVQLLGAMEARGATFAHLFVVRLYRGAFPRLATEDPLLPDAIRGHLRQLLPDLPVKERSAEEERYLFAQLLGSAPEVTLSYGVLDREGRPRAPSPLLDRVRRERGLDFEEAPPADRPPEDGRARQPARRWARWAALARATPCARAAFRVAAASTQPAEVLAEPDRSRLGAARWAVLRALEPPFRDAPVRLSPYLGRVGAVRDAADPRTGPLYVTTCEELARCPWRAFLTRVLRLEPAPDALEALAAASRLHLGSAVHGALERLAREAGAPTRTGLAEALGREAVDFPPPDPEARDAALRAAARDALLDDGLALPGLVDLLAARARPLLDRALRAAAAVVGAELEGEAAVQDPKGGSARCVRFRADRAELREGELRLVDFKTGRRPSLPKSAKTGLSGEVAAGRLLQAAAYAAVRLPEEGGLEVVGELRYLGGEGGWPDSLEVSAGDETVRGALSEILALLETGLREGVLPPLGMLAEAGRDGDARACASCGVREACLYPDSGPRGVLERLREGPTGRDAATRRAAELAGRLAGSPR